MKTFSFYDLSTGHFTGETFGSTEACVERILAMNTREGCGVIEGRYDHRSQRVDLATGLVIDDETLGAVDDAAHRRLAAISKIAELERRQLRPLRELARNPNDTEARRRLDEIEAQIAAARSELSETDTTARRG